MSSPSRSVDRRDAAVTAALSGTVLVILGYASGVGIRPASAEVPAVVTRPAPSPAIAPATPLTPLPVPVAAPPPIVMVPAPQARPRTTPSPTPSPTTPSPTPTPTPSPASTPSCAPDLVTSLVGNLPLLGGVTDLLSCTVGSLLGSTCCGANATPAITALTP